MGWERAYDADGNRLYWDGTAWVTTPPAKQKKPWIIWALIVGGLLLAVSIVSNLANGGPSESYSWGVRAGNTAVALAKAGMNLTESCKTAILSGSMYADNPILNPTPPPENFNPSEAQQGCMDQLHKRLGY